jgi:L-aminopeptidase/D-esterase-like protein
MSDVFKPGPKNLITDVSGLLVGNAQNESLKSGVSVLYGDAPFLAGMHVMGGAPGTRETDLLSPDKLVQMIDAIVLSGGSAFGLDAASGVTDELQKKGRGFPTSAFPVPIVPSAILYDLNNGGDKHWNINPYRELGTKALNSVSKDFKLGSIGAGLGATTLNLKGGLGSASVILNNGTTVGAIIAVSSVGSTVMGESNHFWAAPFELVGEFGNLGPCRNYNSQQSGWNKKRPFKQEATTIGIIATDAILDKSQATRVAVAAQDGIARAIFPSHTPFDGDLLFAVSTGRLKLEDPAFDTLKIGHAAAQCVARSIARAVYNATPSDTDNLPCWSNFNKSH